MSVKLYNHPDLKKQKDKLILYRDLYEGDQETLKDSKYLWTHELETSVHGTKIRAIREERSTYTNHIEGLVSQWTSLILGEDPEIPESIKEILGEKALNDIDGEGSSLVSFIRDQVMKNILVYGRPILKVSSLGDAPRTKAEENGSNFRVYWEVLDPLTLVDWEVETKDPSKLNSFVFLRFEYLQMLPRLSASEEPKFTLYSKEYLVRDSKLVIKKYQAKDKNKDKIQSYFDSGEQWELVDEQKFPTWDKLPVLADVKSESWIKDIAPHALKYYNTESVLDNIVLYQAFQRVYFASENMESAHLKAAAEFTASIVPGDTNVITIPPTDTTAASNRLKEVLNTIYRLGLNQVRIMNADSNQVQSDKTLKEERQNVIDLVKSEIERVENLINHAVRLHAKYLNKEFDENEKIKFSTQVTHDDVDSFVKLVLAFKDEVSRMPNLQKAQLKKYIRSLNLPEEESLLEEVENSFNVGVDPEPEVNVSNVLDEELESDEE